MDREQRLRVALETKRRELVAEIERQVGIRFGDDLAQRVDPSIEIGDRATNVHGEDVDLGVLERKRAIVLEIDGALARLRAGSYGECEECGEPIDEERLAVLPFTPHCVDCRRRAEAESRAFEESGSGFRSGFEDLRGSDDEEE